jgi:hypothetical protein
VTVTQPTEPNADGPGTRRDGVEQVSGVFVASGILPDEIRTWYEVPESVVEELRRTIDPDETFVECLLRLLLEREGTYRQLVSENNRLKREAAAQT